MEITTIKIPDDIKPCPLCGGKVAVAGLNIEFMGEEVMYMECSECGTEFTIHGTKYEKIEVGTLAEPECKFLVVGIPAIDKWNRRA